jgi:hypothetical protein
MSTTISSAVRGSFQTPTSSPLFKGPFDPLGFNAAPGSTDRVINGFSPVRFLRVFLGAIFAM